MKKAKVFSYADRNYIVDKFFQIIIYDIIDVVPEPGQPLTKNRFKEIYAKEQKGPVTALTQVLGFLISAVGQKVCINFYSGDNTYLYLTCV